MPLFQLIFVSRLSESVDADQLRKIAQRGSIANSLKNITGVFMNCGSNIFQLLEGDEKRVLETFGRIKNDPRHHHIEVLLQKPIQKRLFPNWNMEFIENDSRTRLDRQRLIALIRDIADRHDTTHLSVEARMLLNDFKAQFHAE